MEGEGGEGRGREGTHSRTTLRSAGFPKLFSTNSCKKTVNSFHARTTFSLGMKLIFPNHTPLLTGGFPVNHTKEREDSHQRIHLLSLSPSPSFLPAPAPTPARAWAALARD